MPFKYRWTDTQKSIICAEGVGIWSWDNFDRATDEIVDMMKTSPHRVDLVINRPLNSYRPGGSSLPHYNRAMKIFPENFGILILVGPNILRNALVNVLLRVYRNKPIEIRLANSLDNAYAIIQQARDNSKSTTT